MFEGIDELLTARGDWRSRGRWRSRGGEVAHGKRKREGGRDSGCIVWGSRTGRCEASRAELLEAGTRSRRHEISHDVLAAPLAGTPATIGPPDIEFSSPLPSAANDRGRSIYAGCTIICLSPNSKRGFIELKMQQKTPVEIQKLQRSTLKRHPPPKRYFVPLLHPTKASSESLPVFPIHSSSSVV